MSMLKPTFRARVSSITFCRLLHSSLFRAAVKPAEEESMQEQRLVEYCFKNKFYAKIRCRRVVGEVVKLEV